MAQDASQPIKGWKKAYVNAHPILKIAFFIILVGILFIIYAIPIEHIDRLQYQYWSETLAALTGLWCIAKINGKSLNDYGLQKKYLVRDTALGFLTGASIMTMVIGFMWLCGWYHGRLNIYTPGLLENILWCAAIFLAIGISEEVIYRGFFFQTLESRWGSDSAFATTMIIFGLMHLATSIQGISTLLKLIGALSIAVEAGILFAAAYLLTRRLWMPIGLHWAWNFFQGPVYGTPVTGSSFGPSVFEGHITGPIWATGGTFGPEASLPALLVGTAYGIILLITAIRRKKLRHIDGV